MDAGQVLGWCGPILAALATCAGQLWLNQRFKRADEKRDAAQAQTDAKRKTEAEWRDDIDKRMNCQDTKIESVLEAQCTQMRSDITHKIHRYMDDLKCASTEEKDSLWAEYEVYCDICIKHGIRNHFVEQLVKQVMDLPDREHQKKE